MNQPTQDFQLTFRQRQFLMNFSVPFVVDVQRMAAASAGALPALAERAGLTIDQLYEFIRGEPGEQRIARVLAVYAAITHQEAPKVLTKPPGKALATPRRSKSDDEPWFQEFRAAYPARAGDQDWPRARSGASARLKEGHTTEQMIEGAKRYAAFVRATEKEGTEYVKQAGSFLGRGKAFLLPWLPPASALSAMDRITNATAGKGRVIEHG